VRFVFLPGFDGTASLFRYVEPYFLGHEIYKLSYPQELDSSYSAYVEYVSAQLPSGEFHLVAESFSGPIALELVRILGSRIKSLTLVATFAKPPFPKSLLKLFRSMSGIRMPRILIETVLLNSTSPEVVEECWKVIRSIPASGIKGRLNCISNLDFSRGSVSIPTQYLQATKDRLIFPWCFQNLKGFIPNLKRVQIDGPHLLLQSNPQESSKAIVEFATAVERGRKSLFCF
jgi:pimeloyl-ACP methyl ester carboxylesterase